MGWVGEVFCGRWRRLGGSWKEGLGSFDFVRIFFLFFWLFGRRLVNFRGFGCLGLGFFEIFVGRFDIVVFGRAVFRRVFGLFVFGFFIVFVYLVLYSLRDC